MLNYRINKATYESLPDDIKAEYRPNGDGYVLQVAGTTDREAELSNQLQQTVTKLNKAEGDLLQANVKLETAESDAKAATAAEVEGLKTQVNTLQTSQATAHKNAIVDGIANQFTKPELFKSTIGNQVEVTFNDKGEMVTKITGYDGKEITKEQLSDAYVKNDSYKSMLAPVNKNTPTFTPPASGGSSGAAPSQGGTGGGNITKGQDGKYVIGDPSKMTDAEWETYLTAEHPDTSAT